MKDKFAKILLINTIFFLSFIEMSKSELIIPQKKPILSSETLKKSNLNNFVLPLKKPLTSLESEIIITNQKNNIVNGIVIPKSKPLVVKKDKPIVKKKSKYFSEKDFNYAKQAIKLMEKRNWFEAIKVAKKAKDKSIYNFVQWNHLITTGNTSSFFDYKNFIERNKDYPRMGRVKYLSEHKLSTKIMSPKKIIKYFENEKPLSGYGEIILGESYIAVGETTKGITLIKNGWINADLSKAELKSFRKKYKKYLNNDDHIKRADYLAWENKYWDLKRMLRYLPQDQQLLYTARQLLMSKSYGVDNAINKVPGYLKNDAGLNYDRLKWRRKRGRVDSSLEILTKIKNTQDYMVRPDKWWKERSIIARSLIYKKKFTTAYRLTSRHGLKEGPEFAEAEWMSGWISLSFLNDPVLAVDHFSKFYNNVGYPISLSRGAYWLGRSYEKLGNIDESKKWYKESAKYLTTYYGQLSHLKISPNEPIILDDLMDVDKTFTEDFYKKELVKVVYLLDELNKDKYTKHILRYLANENVDQGSEVLAAKLATDIGRFDFAIQVSKIASYQKRFHNKYNYPIISTPKMINKRKIPEAAFILSIIRQESEFDTSANSSAGAKGLMQLMTYTAKTVAKQAKMTYSKSRLTKDPEYNINLGSYYIAGLILEYDGAYPFAIAAYNAGPKRVKYWKKINKNPQKGQIDYVDWIELIKFKETRNYVQRVLENYNVYRYILEQKPIKLKNFFKSEPLY